MSSTTEVVERGLTARALIIGLVLLAALSAWSSWRGGPMMYNEPSPFFMGMWAMFPFLVVVALIQRKVNFTGAELAVIFTLLFWSNLSYQFVGRQVPWGYLYSGRYGWTGILAAAKPYVLELVPSYYGEPAFWILGSVIFIYMGIFLNYIWRKQIIETERLPFPQSAVPISLIEDVTAKTEGRNRLFTNKLFWTGFVIGWLWCLPQFAVATAEFLHIPAPIKVGLWTGIGEPKTSQGLVATIGLHAAPGQWVGGGLGYRLDLTPALYTILPNAHTTIDFALADLGLGFLLPFDVAVSLTIAWIVIFWIIPPIQVAMGTFAALSKPGVMPYWGWAHINRSDGIMTNFTVVISGMIALAIVPMITHRRYLVDTIRAAIRGTKAGVAGWEDPYRLYWGGFIAFFVLEVAFAMVMGVPIGMALFIVIFAVIMLAGMMRVGAEGYMGSNSFWWGLNYPNYLQGGMVPTKDLPTFATGTFNQMTINAWMPGSLWGSPGSYGDGIAVMRIGQRVRSHQKDVLIATAVGIVAASIMALIVGEAMNSMFPFRYGQTGDIMGGMSAVERVTYDLDYDIKSWSYCAIGIVFWSIVLLLRARFAWFILNPVGFILAVPAHFPATMGLPVTLAWVIKRVAVRAGGARLVERLQWLFIGILVGLAMESFVTQIYFNALNFGKPGCACGL